MPKTNSLITRLKKTFPQFNFEESSDYSWSPSRNTVFYVNKLKGHEYIIHELSHALLSHKDFNYDIELLTIERDAWQKATELAPNFGVSISDELIESNLDSYRSWMHSRSTCPTCKSTGLQVKKRVYQCPACTETWRVNDARICGLKRYKLDKK